LQITTRNHGTLTIAPTDIWICTEPILRFEATRRFIWLPHPNPQYAHSPLGVWQSTDQAHVTFVALRDPLQYLPNYRPETDELPLDGRAEDQQWFVLCVVDPQTGQVTANLRAPLVFNRQTHYGGQYILADRRWAMRAPLQALASSQEAQPQWAVVPLESTR